MTTVNDEFKENEEVVMETPEQTDEIIESGENTEEIEIVENGEDTLVQELTDKLQEEESKRFRLLADYENFKRRASLDKEALQKYRAQNIVTNLIPVLDNFARALTVEAKTEEAQTMMTGLDMIYRTFVQALEDEGLVEIQALDQEFDPNFHQAIMTGSDEDKPTGIVLEQMQAGYMLKDRVLRPAMVKVNE
ncbi:nucleotide exchange factor GrpE [Sporosarcina sp. E16_8]|uniref:nucleotide exchange factor GrpE n=1 Tax=Sporosarcina sp. E16_8 TaxID=2789295 RepID=UPI001A9377DB|nr:nucleotide exchange factor GrpE [Sporosarcina sp. E16_8]MBO0588248.1 nucleotide exchange factor GrpE [Sporosarcina sp. E16_8]